MPITSFSVISMRMHKAFSHFVNPCLHLINYVNHSHGTEITFTFLTHLAACLRCRVCHLTGRGFPESMRPSACTCRRDFENLLICDVALSHRCIAAGLTRGLIQRNGAKRHFVISFAVPDAPELTRRANFFDIALPADSVSEG